MLLALDVADADEICLVVNDAAAAYRGVIPADRWKEPYMPLEEVHAEIGAGVVFWGFRRGGRLAGVMGLQQVHDVALIRHAYTRTSEQGAGVGSALLENLRRQTDRPLLVGTWKAATWAMARLVPTCTMASTLPRLTRSMASRSFCFDSCAISTGLLHFRPSRFTTS